MSSGTPLYTTVDQLKAQLGDAFSWVEQPATPRLILSVEGDEKSGKCLIGTALVTNYDTGERVEVQNLKRGDRIVSLTGHVTVLEVACDGIKPVWEVELTDGRKIQATAEHKFHTGVGWVELKNLHPNDILLVPQSLTVAPGKSESLELASVLAYLLADGGLTSTSMRFTKAEPALREEFQECVQELGLATSDYSYPEKTATVGVRSGSITTTSFRERWNLYSHSRDKEIHPEVFLWNRDVQVRFLNRLMTCDGWVCARDKGLEIGYCSASEKLVQGLSHLMLRFGIPGNVRVKTVGETPYWTWTGNTQAVLDFVSKVGFFGADAAKAQGLVEGYQAGSADRRSGPKKYGYTGPQPVMNGMWMRIRSITPKGNVAVWDIETDEHTFIANDIYTHNTHFAMTAPAPIVFLNIDKGEEGVRSKFTGKPIAEAEYAFKVPSILDRENMLDVTNAIKLEWDRFVRDYRAALAAGARTIIVDTMSEAWEFCRLARLGKLTQVMPQHYGPLNAEFRELIRLAYSGSSNLILLHKTADEYTDNAKTGQRKRKGFADMGFMVQSVLRTRRVPAKTHVDSMTGQVVRDEEVKRYVDILDSRQAPHLTGLSFQGMDFPGLAMMLRPDVDPAVWY